MKNGMSLLLVIYLTSIKINGITQWDGNTYNQHSQPQLLWFKEFSNSLPILGHEDILDIGCGDGKLTNEIANRLNSGTITGIDISKNMIDFARNNYSGEKISFLVNDARNFKLNQKFNLIVSFTALHWVKEIDQVIQQAKKHLKPNGRIYFIFSTKWNELPIEKAMQTLYKKKSWSAFFKNYDPGYYIHDVDPLMTELNNQGFLINELAIKNKHNIFKNDEELFYWLKAWLPQQKQVPNGKGDDFIRDFIDEYTKYETRNSKGIHWDGFLIKIDALLKTSMP